MAVKFERQHFNAIAKILRTERNEARADYEDYAHEFGATQALYSKAKERCDMIADLTDRFADYFEQGNELFDRQQFIDAVEREDTHDA